jgi:radical SAM superfamily enzyme YgiQ (UPF0313 family)
MQPPVAPVALDYLADVLDAHGLAVSLLDLCFEQDVEKAVSQALAGSAPALVGLTIRNTDDCYLASSDDCLPGFATLVSVLRQHTPAPIVLGGSGFSIAPAAVLRALGADYGIAGDGEVPLVMLASALATGGDLSTIPGLVWRQGGTTEVNPPWAGSPAALPARSRTWLDNQRYFAEGGQAGIETKRGCNGGCIYCADPLGKGRALRLRSPGQVADEFEVLLSQGIDHFHLCDSEFNIPRDHALAVCQEMMQRGLGGRAHWYTYASPSEFTSELAQDMRQAGCVGVNFGADSADDRMLHTLGRDFQVGDLWQTAKACREAGLVFMFDLLLGGPGETRESVARTIEAMKAIGPDRVGVSLGLRIYPGTALSRLVQAAGPISGNPNLRGVVAGNPDFLAPVFYLSSALGSDAERYVSELVARDQRFFFPTAEAGTECYNYSNNQRLVEAIERGYRGAYWDILRRLAEGSR